MARFVGHGEKRARWTLDLVSKTDPSHVRRTLTRFDTEEEATAYAQRHADAVPDFTPTPRCRTWKKKRKPSTERTQNLWVTDVT